MVLLVQRAQNRDSLVLHLKLNELIAATQGTSRRMISTQNLSKWDTKALHQFCYLLAEKAKQGTDLG